MKKVIFVLLFAAISGMTFAQKAETLVKTGMTVPDFEVKMFDGQTVQMKDLRGKVVLLNFWATWCPDCIRELARVQTGIIDRFQGKDFVFLPISRQDSYEKIKAFREKRGHTFPMGMDPGPENLCSVCYSYYSPEFHHRPGWKDSLCGRRR